MSGHAAYSASKAGLLGLSAALAKEYGRKGITSNALLLSLFETDMTLKELSAQNREFYEAHCPVGRIGQVGEVAAAVLFLASDGASFINGQAARRHRRTRLVALSHGHRHREDRRLPVHALAGHRASCARRAGWTPQTSAAGCSATSGPSWARSRT